ncbi:hypothetical protein OG873_04115 [Streptomyces violaceus]|uniref:hypothetical protein n=1 Tax=Streptomyces violaceus TaxID=1936 RepID=UPI002E2809EE|nr:hypothetical protein [Streptomyces violaceus]
MRPRLCADGPVVAPDRDPDDGHALLRAALTASEHPLEETREAVLRSLPPDRRTDDAALLLARTRALSRDRVATWDLPAAPVMFLAVLQEGRWPPGPA